MPAQSTSVLPPHGHPLEAMDGGTGDHAMVQHATIPHWGGKNTHRNFRKDLDRVCGKVLLLLTHDYAIRDSEKM